MTVDESYREVWAAMQQRHRPDSARTTPTLQGGGGGDNSGGMEVRVARLEAHMEHALDELAKLSTVPADVAVIKERLNHIPTRVEGKADIETAIERSAARTQRIVAIVGGLVTIAVA